MAEDRIYTEKEPGEMTSRLLREHEPEPAGGVKSKNDRKKDAGAADARTPEERLAQLLEKGKNA